MMRSLYSGISGLRNHQTRMDVIGNNIANVNTVGYKTSRVVFQDIFSQTVSGGMGNTGAIGGTNPTQIGLGIRLSTIDVMHTRAAFQRTDNATDMMINGDGFFVLEGPEGNLYTRAGNFYIDDEGYLVSSHGFFVLGDVYSIVWGEISPAVPAVPPDPGSAGDTPPITNPNDPNFRPPTPGSPAMDAVFGFVVDDNTPPEFGRIRVRAVDGNGQLVNLPGFAVADNGTVSVIANNRKLDIAQIMVSLFSNPGGLEKAGNSLYMQTASSGEPIITAPMEPGAGRIDSGGLEMSNVDLATEFTDMIVTQRGFQANSRIITVSDTMLEELVNLKR